MEDVAVKQGFPLAEAFPDTYIFPNSYGFTILT